MAGVLSITGSLYRKIVKSILITICLALVACGGNNTDGVDQADTHSKQVSLDVAEFELPKITASSFNTAGELKAYVSVDDGERKVMELDGENALLNIEGLTTGSHQVHLEFEYHSDSFGEVTVATLTKQFEISNGKNWLTITQEEYQIEELDDDNDGVSNLYELTNDSQPSNPTLPNNFPPEFVSSSKFSQAENSVDPLTISAKDANQHALNYSLVGGADSKLFTIEVNTGLLRFLAPPNFENPSDSDGNNLYEVEINVADELGASASQLVSIEVTDVSPENEPQSLVLDENPPELMIKNEQVQISANGTGTGVISYISSNDGVLYVSDSGVLVAKSPGIATITATIAADALYQAASTSFTVEVITDSFTLYGWVGEDGSELSLPPEMEGVEFYRTGDRDCDLSNVGSCSEGSLDVLNGQTQPFFDATARLDQVASYGFKKGDAAATGEFGGRPITSYYDHQVVAFQDKIWLIGGHGREGYTNDIWSTTDGVLWLKEKTEAKFSEREGHQVVLFKGKLWLIAGGRYNIFHNDVWSSEDGINWTQETASAEFAPRLGHQVVVYLDELWLIAGESESKELNDVWRSSDGIHWTEVTSSAAFRVRKGHQVVVFKDKLTLIGGGEGFTYSLSDVWTSTDGETWVESTSDSSLPSKAGHQVVVYENKLWLLGGGIGSGVLSSSDAVTWKRESTQDFLVHRYKHQVVLFKNRLWVIGGEYYNSRIFNDVWSSSNGVTWREEMSQPPFTGRSGHQAVDFQNKLWIIGGDDEDLRNDIWSSSDGLLWSQEAASAPFSERRDHQVVEFKGKLFLLGGYGAGNKNDIWSSNDGVNWQEEISEAAFPATDNHQVTQFQEQLWMVINDYVDGSYEKELWRSPDGVNWQAVNVSMPVSNDNNFDLITFDNKLWLSFGATIWYTEDGVNWEQAGSYAQNSFHQLAVFNNKLFLITESFSSQRRKNVLSSSDGSSWNIETSEPAFSSRIGFEVVDFQGQLMLIGGRAGDYSAEVWKSNDGINWKIGMSKFFQVK